MDIKEKEKLKKIIFALIKKSVCGTPLPKKLKAEITPEILRYIFAFSVSQDIYELVFSAVYAEEIPLDEEMQSKTGEKDLFFVIRHEYMVYAQKQIENVFTKNQIPYILLKGAVLRKYYPDAQMRSSYDVDVLVKKQDLNKAEALLKDELGYSFYTRTSHDIGFFTQKQINVELHFDLIDYYNDMNKEMIDVFDIATESETNPYALSMPNKNFVYYHLAHMAKHVLYSGLGIKSLIDLKVLEDKGFFDRKEVLALAEEGGIRTFSEETFNVVDYVFNGKKPTEVSLNLLDFMMSGGAFGNEENRLVYSRRHVKGGKFGSIIRYIFPPYKSLKNSYPKLEGKRILLPFFWIKRWFKVFSKKKRQSLSNTVNTSKNLTKEKEDGINEFISSLDLKKFMKE